MKYEYITATEKTEIEITEEWGTVLFDLDRQERNNQKTENRRHVSLYAFNLDDTLFPSDVNIPAEYELQERNVAIIAAVAQLLPEQQKLIDRIYFKNEKIVDIAREDGVSHVAILDRLNRINKKLKKFF